MEGYSPDIAENLRKQLEAIAPEAFADGKLNVEALKRALGEEHVLEQGEHYHLDWPGKSAAYKVLQASTSATLRPQPELSVNFNTAEHVFIEGENLEVLKVLQKAYFGKVKLIYIDPPYNTGSDSFIYPDKFQESKASYLQRINALDDEGQLLREGFFRKNSKESGHYHSNWLNMMLPRLYLARNLMHENAVILVSIDDHEAANLKLLMDEVCGAENFIAQLIWEKGRKNDARLFSVGHEYLLVYARNLISLQEKKTLWREAKPGAKEIIEKWRGLTKIHGNNFEAIQQELRLWYASLPNNNPSKKLARYKWVDKNGPWRDRDISWPGGGGPRYDVLHPITKQPCKVPERGWGFASPEEMQRQIRLDLVEFRADHTEPPFRKAHLLPVPDELDDEQLTENDNFESDEEDDEEIGLQVMSSVIYKQSQVSVKYLRKLLGGKLFNNPKDHEVLARLISYCLGDDNSALVVDFFAGSASTVEAVLRLNQRNGGERKVLTVQLPESCDEKSAAYKAGYLTIADIARERIRRVIQKIHDEADLTSPAPENLGFKSFVLAPSNFKQWRGDCIENEEQLAEQLELFVRSEKDGADIQNMVYELLLKAGFPLTTHLERLSISDSPVYSVNKGQLLLVLETFNFGMIEPLVAMKPKEILCLDSVFQGNDELKTNLDLQCRDAGMIFTCI